MPPLIVDFFDHLDDLVNLLALQTLILGRLQVV